MNKTVYPEWVLAQREKGTTVKKVGEHYYLYKHTSKRVPGKKYPQPVDTYIGVITPNGVIRSEKKKISLSGVEVREYGYSKALEHLCPESWKNALGEDWQTVFLWMVQKWSPESYLTKDKELIRETEIHYQLATQMGSFSRKVYKEHRIDLSEIEVLKTIYLVYLGKEKIISNISREQKTVLDKIGLDLSLC